MEAPYTTGRARVKFANKTRRRRIRSELDLLARERVVAPVFLSSISRPFSPSLLSPPSRYPSPSHRPGFPFQREREGDSEREGGGAGGKRGVGERREEGEVLLAAIFCNLISLYRTTLCYFSLAPGLPTSKRRCLLRRLTSSCRRTEFTREIMRQERVCIAMRTICKRICKRSARTRNRVLRILSVFNC